MVIADTKYNKVGRWSFVGKEWKIVGGIRSACIYVFCKSHMHAWLWASYITELNLRWKEGIEKMRAVNEI